MLWTALIIATAIIALLAIGFCRLVVVGCRAVAVFEARE